MITNERVRALIACDREALITLMAAARSRGLYDVWKDLDIRALFDAVDAELQVHKALVAQRALLAGTLALIDAELATRMGPTIVVQQQHVDAAARLFLTNPAFKAAAAMLAFSAQVEGDPADRVAPLGEPGPAVLPDEEGM